MKQFSGVLGSALVMGVLVFSSTVIAGEHGDSCAEGTIVNADGSTTRGNLTASESDFFLIDAPSAGRLTAWTTGTTDTRGIFRRASGTLITTDDASGPPPSNFLLSRLIDVERYCLEVNGASATASGAYELVIEGDFANDDHGSTCRSATVLSSTRTPGELGVYADADYRTERKAHGFSRGI